MADTQYSEKVALVCVYMEEALKTTKIFSNKWNKIEIRKLKVYRRYKVSTVSDDVSCRAS